MNGSTVPFGRRLFLFLAGVGVTLGVACGSPQVRTDVAMIYLTSTPPDALVLIDDVPIGRVSDLREHVTVPSGEHRLEIRAEDFLSYYADLDLQGGESYGLIIELWPGRDELDE